MRTLTTTLVAFALCASAPDLRAQTPGDTLALSLGEALALGLRVNPQIRQADASRAAAGAQVWSAYGALLPQIMSSAQMQYAGRGSFVIAGTEFDSPQTYSTVYSWDVTHSLLDAGRDWFRIKSARAGVDRALAEYDERAFGIASDIKLEYVRAKQHAALARQAEREIERRSGHVRLADARYEVGAVTRSDVLEANLQIRLGEVDLLRARQSETEARLALRRLLGNEIPPGPLRLTTDFPPFDPDFDVEELVDRALADHPALRQTRAQERIDEAGVSIARSAYLPTFQFQYSLYRSVTDTNEFEFSDFDKRNFAILSLSWPLFGRFERYSETSRARAALRTTREEEEFRESTIDENVRLNVGRVETAWASYQAFAAGRDLAAENLRLGEGRYETGTGTFLDLLDARTRASRAETDVINAAYEFYAALILLERATGLQLLPEEIQE